MIYQGKLPDCYGNFYECDQPPDCPCMMDCVADSREEYKHIDNGMDGESA